MADETKTVDTNEPGKTPEVTDPAPKQEDKKAEVDYKAEYEKLLTEQKKLKEATDKACTEAANFKKALREKQSEAERTEAERAEREAAQLEELNKLRTESRVNSYKSKLLDCGYDLDTAASMAAALPDGINDDFFAKQKAFMESQKKTIEAELLNKQPGLSKGAPLTQDDAEKLEDQKLREWFGLK